MCRMPMAFIQPQNITVRKVFFLSITVNFFFLVIGVKICFIFLSVHSTCFRNTLNHLMFWIRHMLTVMMRLQVKFPSNESSMQFIVVQVMMQRNKFHHQVSVKLPFRSLLYITFLPSRRVVLDILDHFLLFTSIVLLNGISDSEKNWKPF